jgi:hypothetical protein
MRDASLSAANRVTESGLQLPRPGWVGWIARDRDGSWWGYSVEPQRNDTGWYENELGLCVRLDAGPVCAWEQSLQAVPADHRRARS